MLDPEPWLSREHPGPRGKPLPLARDQCRAIEETIRPGKAEQRIVRRGQSALLMAAGVSVRDTAKAIGVDSRTVGRWRRRFLDAADPVAALADAPRSGRPISLFRTPTRRG